MKLEQGAAAAAATSLTTKVQVVYQLCREGKLEHPHMIDVEYPTHQNGLRLRGTHISPLQQCTLILCICSSLRQRQRNDDFCYDVFSADVKKRLNKLRGKGMSESFAWSYKRSYKNAYIWRDLTEKDVILPLQGSKEYVLKASELRLDAYQAHHHDHQHQSSTLKPSKLIAGLVSNPSLTQQKITVNPHVKKQSSSIGSSNRNVELNQKMLDSLKATTHMCNSRKHDSYASGCCKSSSSQHSSECENSIKDNTQRKTSSHIISEAAAEHVNAREKPAGLCLPSSTEIPMKMRISWKREVPGKCIFFRGNNRSRVSNSEISPVSEVQVERKKSQFHHSQTTTHEVDVGSIVNDSKKPQQPCFLEEHCYPSFARENVGCDNLFAVQAQNEVHLEQLPPPCLNLRSVWARWCKGLRVTKSSSGTMGKKSKPSKPMICNGHTFEESKIKSTTQSQNLEEAETMTLTHQEVLVATTGVESEACTKLGASNCSVKQQSPVSTSDDNQHNLMVSGVQDSHEALPAAPQPLSRYRTWHDLHTQVKEILCKLEGYISASSSSLLHEYFRVQIDLGICSSLTICRFGVLASDLLVLQEPPWPAQEEEGSKLPLIPGLTKHNWEKMLQQALCNSLPPPDFEKLLKKCLHCGRTFKPDSLIVHKRGCHSLQKRLSHIATKTSHGGSFGRHSLQAY
ncbi:unnamed protein product [Sphagnum jensenii]|uniref:SOSEKI DIX-like domain-containing protein n=1 Tax=Sphagnum jensenii TaxID=128206 RepID=A0ABP1AWZ5_9BRYO